MNKLSIARRAEILHTLIEGNSIRSTVRLAGAAKATVLKLLVETGEFCSVYQDRVLRNLACQQIEADAIWAFVRAKHQKATKDSQRDTWTYTALDSDSKLMVSWLVGTRNSANTKAFMADVAERLACRVQLTTDGLGWYHAAAEGAFGWNGVDFAQIVKTYGEPAGDGDASRRHSRPVSTHEPKTPIMGNPAFENVSTSYVGRSDRSKRMESRHFTRLMDGFSKKAQNHAQAVSLYFMHYNFCRPHQKLTKARGGMRTTPAMAAGVAKHVWTVEEILAKVDPATPLRRK